MEKPDSPPAPSAPTPPVRAEEPALLPTIRDHAERLQLLPWQVAAIVARLHGEHVDGKRLFADGASLNTRMSDADFDAAAQRALHGRI